MDKSANDPLIARVQQGDVDEIDIQNILATLLFNAGPLRHRPLCVLACLAEVYSTE